MPWKEASAMSLRIEFLTLARLPAANPSELARRFGIRRTTAHEWVARHRDGQPPTDRSRRPSSSPHRSPDAVERAVLAVRDEYPAWGGRKIRAVLARAGHPRVPAASTITAILRRHARLDGPGAGRPRDGVRFEHPAPNDLWPMDFQGHFALTGGGRGHPPTVLDDHSRYAVGLVPCADETLDTVRNASSSLFRTHGLPARTRMDNGAPWGDAAGQPYTRLTVWLLRSGVRVSHGRPYHPQTQGQDGRFHRTPTAELLSRHTWTDLGECGRRFDPWRRMDNRERPHEALGPAVPADRYRVSPRPLPDALPVFEYPPGTATRVADVNGRFGYRRRSVRLSKGFAGERVGVRAGVGGGSDEVWFGPHRLGGIDLAAGTVVRTPRPPDGVQ